MKENIEAVVNNNHKAPLNVKRVHAFTRKSSFVSHLSYITRELHLHCKNLYLVCFVVVVWKRKVLDIRFQNL